MRAWRLLTLLAAISCLNLLGGCVIGSSGPALVRMEATAYCSCSECNGQWAGQTASGADLEARQAGLVSLDTLKRPWMVVPRSVFYPWIGESREGLIAADTDYYPFGTRMNVPGYGWGVVRDRGSAIKGPNRIDLLFSSHGDANGWGRRQVDVEVVLPDGSVPAVRSIADSPSGTISGPFGATNSLFDTNGATSGANGASLDANGPRVVTSGGATSFPRR